MVFHVKGRMFENWFLKKIFGLKRDEVRGHWRKWYIGVLQGEIVLKYNFHSIHPVRVGVVGGKPSTQTFNFQFTFIL